MFGFELLEGERIDTVNADIKLIQKKNGLTFGTDTYLLCAYVKPRKNAVMAELGSGTGIAALLSLSYNKCKHVHAIEVQEEFCSLISRNAKLNGLDDKITVHNTDVRNATPDMLGKEVDVVISNPPYMKTDSGKRNAHDEKYIARHEVFGGIDDFCAAASRLLKHGGKFYCVYRPDRLIDLISAMRNNKLEPKNMTFVHAHENKEPSIVLVDAIKGGAPSLKITKPLFLYSSSDSGEMSDESRAIYSRCSFYED